MTAQQIDVYLKQADRSSTATAERQPSRLRRRRGQRCRAPSSPARSITWWLSADVVVTEPNRRAVGDQLVYTADDGKYVLTGKSPSIFDAEHGTVWGDSLTFYSRDDRVLVESKRSSPTITRARTTK